MLPGFKLLIYAALLIVPLLAIAERAHPVRLGVTQIDSRSPRFSWTLATAEATPERGIVQTAFEVRVATSAALSASGAGLWDSGQVASAAMNTVYAGKALPAASLLVWQVRVWTTAPGRPTAEASSWSTPATFNTGLATWTGYWIAASPDAATGAPLGLPNDQRLPVFRRGLTLKAAPVQALLFVTGLGQYEFRINTANVTDDVLMPGWTGVRKRIFYNIHDVRSLLNAGPNTLAVLLGNGMYNALEVKGRYSKFSSSAGQPKLIAELHLSYADGSSEIVGTDGSWRTAPGPITLSNTYGGEDFNAQLEGAGWDGRRFDDSGWTPALLVGSPGGTLVADRTPPIRVTAHPAAVAITHPRAGTTVYDLGENFAGWPVLRATGPRGAVIRLVPGELLDAHGLVTQRSANAFPGDPVEFRYTLAGIGSAETWHPRFTYYGFRYVQVEADASIHIASLDGEAIRADAPPVGSFTSSEPLFNSIHTLIMNAARSNMVSVLTDCPHREKLGWLEQTHLFAGSLMANYDVSALYNKMADDMADDQDPDGLVPSTAPEVTKFLDRNGRSNDFRDSPEWGSAAVLSPWAAFQTYGDPGPLAAHYSSMQRYVAYLQGRTKGKLLSYGLGDWYDIGPKEPGYSQLTSKSVTASGILYQDLVAMAGIATALQKPADARSYREQAASLREAFNAALFHADTHQYDRGSQTANAMPLALGLVPPAERAAVLGNLIGDIQAHDFHVTAGDIGFHYVVRALTDAGRSDVLAHMLTVTTSPSYGYQLAKGATTLTEAWDTNPNSSQNHFMLGHAEEWFSRGLAGINLDMSRPVGEQVRIVPYVPQDGTLTHAAATLETPLGTVSSEWTVTASSVTLTVTVPPNASAALTLPSWLRAARESGKLPGVAPGVHTTADPSTFLLDSGVYRVEATR